MNSVGDGLHAVGEVLAVVVEPISDKGLIAVVYLEDIDAVMRPRKSLEVAQDYFFVYLLEVVVPRGIAGEPVYALLFGQTHGGEIFVEHLVIATDKADNVKHLIRLAHGQPLDILFHGEEMLIHIGIKNSISVSFAERTEQLKLIPAAEIGICKAVEEAGSGFVAGEGVVAGGYRHILYGFSYTRKRGHAGIDILRGHLGGSRPRLIAVDKEFFVFLILVPELKRGGYKRYRARGNKSQLDAALVVDANDREVRTRKTDRLINCAGERIF